MGLFKVTSPFWGLTETISTSSGNPAPWIFIPGFNPSVSFRVITFLSSIATAVSRALGPSFFSSSSWIGA